LMHAYSDLEREYFFLSRSDATRRERQSDLTELGFKLKHLASLVKKGISNEVFGRNARGVVFETANGLMAADLGDVEIANALGFKGGYSVGQIAFLKHKIAPADCVYVIGAHIGTMTIPVAGLCAKLYAFEPNPDSCKLLEMNVRLNNVTNATLFNLGTYNENRQLSFLQSRANSGGSKMIPKRPSFMYSYDDPDKIDITVVRLDDFIEQQHLLRPDFIILDVEGAEYATLQGAERALAGCRCLYMEFVPHHLQNVAGVSVDDLLSTLLPYFDNLQIAGREGTFRGNEIRTLLIQIFSNGVSCDLLFSKK